MLPHPPSHSRERGNLRLGRALSARDETEIPAFAGMTWWLMAGNPFSSSRPRAPHGVTPAEAGIQRHPHPPSLRGVIGMDPGLRRVDTVSVAT